MTPSSSDFAPPTPAHGFGVVNPTMGVDYAHGIAWSYNSALKIAYSRTDGWYICPAGNAGLIVPETRIPDKLAAIIRADNRAYTVAREVSNVVHTVSGQYSYISNDDYREFAEATDAYLQTILDSIERHRVTLHDRFMEAYVESGLAS